MHDPHGEPAPCEQAYLTRSGRAFRYHRAEAVPLLFAANLNDLAGLITRHLLEWASVHPEGLVLLDTGRVMQRVAASIATLPANERKALGRMQLVQGLELVTRHGYQPIRSRIHELFFDSGVFSADRAILLDTSIVDILDLEPERRRVRHESGSSAHRRRVAALERLESVARRHAERIALAGGIGFSVCELGPNGMILGNEAGVRVQDTRVTSMSRDSADRFLGRHRLVDHFDPRRRVPAVTTGPQVFSSGEETVSIVAAAEASEIEHLEDCLYAPQDSEYPARSFASGPAGRVYALESAAPLLRTRYIETIEIELPLSEHRMQQCVMDISLSTGRPVAELARRDYLANPLGTRLLERSTVGIGPLNTMTLEGLHSRLSGGLRRISEGVVLHIEPLPHSAIMALGPWIARLRGSSGIHQAVAVLRSAPYDVPEEQMLDLSIRMLGGLHDDRLGLASMQRLGYFQQGRADYRSRDAWTYLDGLARQSEAFKDVGRLRRLLRNLYEVYGADSVGDVQERVEALIRHFEDADHLHVEAADLRHLRSLQQEWSSDCLWTSFGCRGQDVQYFGGASVPRRLKDMLAAVRPDIVTIPFDPDGSGPAPLYETLGEVLPVLADYQASRRAAESGWPGLRIVGYRMPGSVGRPSEADVFIPVSISDLASIRTAIVDVAGLPDDYVRLIEQTVLEQYGVVSETLGAGFLRDHEHDELRSAVGMSFLQDRPLDEILTGLTR
ncbi:MAG: hypothetical protein ACLFNQ_12390 [Spirochaetaceae bacterium]